MTLPRTVAVGIGLAVVAALLSGVAVFANGLIVRQFPDQTLLAAVRNGGVGVVLLIALTAGGRRTELDGLAGRQRLGLAVLGIIGGGIPFALFFTGLAQATATDAAIIQKTLFVWVALLAVPLLGERLGLAQVGGMGVLLAGTLLIAPSGSLSAGPGSVLILAATLLWTVEVIVARRLLGGVRALPAAMARMTLGSLVLFAIVAANGHLGQLGAWTTGQWAAVAVTGLILAGYVMAWYGALRRAPATTVTSVLVGAAVITAALQAISTDALPAGGRLAGLALLLIGGLLVAAASARAATVRRAVPLPAVDGSVGG